MLLFLKINSYAMNEKLFTKQRKINGYGCSIREIWSVVSQNILIPSIIFYFHCKRNARSLVHSSVTFMHIYT
jgi:hypothetical protein